MTLIQLRGSTGGLQHQRVCFCTAQSMWSQDVATGLVLQPFRHEAGRLKLVHLPMPAMAAAPSMKCSLRCKMVGTGWGWPAQKTAAYQITVHATPQDLPGAPQ